MRQDNGDNMGITIWARDLGSPTRTYLCYLYHRRVNCSPCRSKCNRALYTSQYHLYESNRVLRLRNIHVHVYIGCALSALPLRSVTSSDFYWPASHSRCVQYINAKTCILNNTFQVKSMRELAQSNCDQKYGYRWVVLVKAFIGFIHHRAI